VLSDAISQRDKIAHWRFRTESDRTERGQREDRE
jgi:hypothetical protein